MFLSLFFRKMFVRVNKLDGVPDDNGGKGGWWTVQPGVPDEGRPGRKAKSKRPHDSGGEIEGVDGEMGVRMGIGMEIGYEVDGLRHESLEGVVGTPGVVDGL